MQSFSTSRMNSNKASNIVDDPMNRMNDQELEMNCCPSKTTANCCSNKAAATLVGLNKCTAAKEEFDDENRNKNQNHVKDTAEAEVEVEVQAEAEVMNGYNDDSSLSSADGSTLELPITTTITGRCAKKSCSSLRKRTISVDFTPCAFCELVPVTKKYKQQQQQQPMPPLKRTFVDDLKALASFLKSERDVLKNGSADEMNGFYQPSKADTELVAEWRTSGHQVYASMRKKLRRLEDMEAKFGSWQEHFG